MQTTLGRTQEQHTETPTKCNRRALLVTFTEYGEYNKLGKYIMEPSHHTIGFLTSDDLLRYKLFHKQQNGEDLFVSKHTNVPMRPCIVKMTDRTGQQREYHARYGYADCCPGANDGQIMLFILANIRTNSRTNSLLSFSAESFMIKQENGVRTFVGGGRKYCIVATD